jgi:hypothetical protein
MWPIINETCGGNMQSPINIDQTALVYDSSLGPFSFSNYDTPLDFTMYNDGETGKLSFFSFYILSIK